MLFTIGDHTLSKQAIVKHPPGSPLRRGSVYVSGPCEVDPAPFQSSLCLPGHARAALRPGGGAARRAVRRTAERAAGGGEGGEGGRGESRGGRGEAEGRQTGGRRRALQSAVRWNSSRLSSPAALAIVRRSP